MTSKLNQILIDWFLKMAGVSVWPVTDARRFFISAFLSLHPVIPPFPRLDWRSFFLPHFPTCHLTGREIGMKCIKYSVINHLDSTFPFKIKKKKKLILSSQKVCLNQLQSCVSFWFVSHCKKLSSRGYVNLNVHSFCTRGVVLSRLIQVTC